MEEAKLKMVIEGENKANKAISEAQGQLNGLKGKLENMAPVFKGMAVAGTVAFGALSVGIKSAIDASQEAAKVQAQLGAVLKSTGGIAGITAEKAIELSRALQKQSTFGDEAILSAENILLTFTKITEDIFPDATRVVLDMSTALGQDLQSSAIQLGKALQDPILGVSALRRVGVNFTEDQQELIKTLVETGRVAEAQQMIIRELTTEFGGSASAQTETFAGKMTMLKERMSDMYEVIGNSLIPIFTDMFDKVSPVVDKITEWAEKNPDLTKKIIIGTAAFAGLAAVLGISGLALPSIITGIEELITVAGVLGKALLFLTTNPIGWLIIGIGLVIGAILLLKANWKEVTEFLTNTWKAFTEWFQSSVDIFMGSIKKVGETIDKWFGPAVKGISSAVSSVSGFVGGVAEKAGGAISSILPQSSKTITPFPVSTQNSNVIQFNFNGDVSDIDTLQKRIMETLDRATTLQSFAGQ